MGECNFNGTCDTCTSNEMEFVQTEDDLTCCVSDAGTIPGWLKFIARKPSDCPSATSWNWGILATISILSVLGIGAMLFIIHRFKARGYNHIREQSPPEAVFSRVAKLPPTPNNWENIEMFAITASMEATTAL